MTAIAEHEIVALIDAFYAKVRRDEVLAPVFERAIAAAAWPVHLAKMYDFWSGAMLSTGRYRGNPLAVHLAVEGLEEGMFARWLALFRATAEALLSPDHAEAFRTRSELIAKSPKLGVVLPAGLEPARRRRHIFAIIRNKRSICTDGRWPKLKIPEQSQFTL
ncbi:MAG TPA: group III truncated hemoglobin, partial [Stellaceae bacterium]